MDGTETEESEKEMEEEEEAGRLCRMGLYVVDECAWLVRQDASDRGSVPDELRMGMAGLV